MPQSRPTLPGAAIAQSCTGRESWVHYPRGRAPEARAAARRRAHAGILRRVSSVRAAVPRHAAWGLLLAVASLAAAQAPPPVRRREPIRRGLIRREPARRSPAARRAGALGWRGARHRARRCAEGARRHARAGRCHRRHQHGCGGRRAVRERPVGARDREDHDLAQLAGRVPRPPAARGPDAAPQAGGSELPGEVSARCARRQDPAAEGPDRGAESERAAAPADAASGTYHQLRRAADALPCGGDRPRDRRAGSAGLRRPHQRNARQHVGPRHLRAGGAGGPDPGGRRYRRQRTGRYCAPHGRRHRDRGGRRRAAPRARQAQRRHQHLQPDARDHDPPQRRAAARHAWTEGRTDRAAARGGLVIRLRRGRPRHRCGRGCGARRRAGTQAAGGQRRGNAALRGTPRRVAAAAAGDQIRPVRERLATVLGRGRQAVRRHDRQAARPGRDRTPRQRAVRPGGARHARLSRSRRGELLRPVDRCAAELHGTELPALRSQPAGRLPGQRDSTTPRCAS